jgi:hypothetical protein
MFFESARLKTYRRLRQESSEIYSPLCRYLSKDDLYRVGDALGLIKKGAFDFDDTGMDLAAVQDFGLFEITLADPRRLESILQSLIEGHRYYITDTKDSAYSVYQVIEVDRHEKTLVVKDRLRGDARHEIVDLTLSQTLTPREDILLAWRLIRLEGMEMTTGVMVPVEPSSLTAIQNSLNKRMAKGSTFKTAMARLWATCFRKRHQSGVLCVIDGGMPGLDVAE